MPPHLQHFSFGTVERSLRPAAAKRAQRAQVEAERRDQAQGGGQSENQAKKRFRKRPRPDVFSLLPLELFEEICSYLSPGDLLHLSLLNQRLFSLLRSARASRKVWHHAIKTEGEDLYTLVDESSLTPVEYAFLAYGGWCQACATTFDTADITLYSPLRLKCCTSCAVKLLHDDQAIRAAYPTLHNRALRCCAATHYAPKTALRTRNIYRFLPTVLAHSAILCAIDANDHSPTYDAREAYCQARYDLVLAEEDLGLLTEQVALLALAERKNRLAREEREREEQEERARRLRWKDAEPEVLVLESDDEVVIL
ncbi:hypothetical protein JCM10213_008923 [Rhodosporidiobolus nylandii]